MQIGRSDKMKEIMITSGFDFEGYKITEYIGFYSGECALGTGFLSSLEAGLSDIFGLDSTLYADKLLKAKSMAISGLKKLAKEHGANAIIGLDIDYITFSADIMGVVANGTAVKVEGNSPQNHTLSDIENFPIVNYYENLMIRPFHLFLNSNTSRIKISMYNYKEAPVNAVNVDIIANTIFGTVYTFPDINFVKLTEKENIIETEEVFLNIEDNQLKVIQSITLKINYYVLSGKVYSLNEKYQISGLPIEKLQKLRKEYGEDVVSDFHEDFSDWTCLCGHKNNVNTRKCLICERMKRQYTRAKNGKKITIGSILPELMQKNNCIEIYNYLKDTEQKKDFQFPEKIMNDVEKMKDIERVYGNMKDSLISILKKFVAENE